MIVDEGRAERFPFAPEAKSKATSPQALPTQKVNIGGFTYLKQMILTLSINNKIPSILKIHLMQNKIAHTRWLTYMT